MVNNINNIKNEKILEAAIKLLSVQGTSVPTAKIAQQAAVSNGTLFNYYPTKKALLDGVYLSIKKEVSAHVINQVARETKHIEDLVLYLWQQYISWAMANTLKQQVASLLRGSFAISDEARASVDEIFSFINIKLEEAQNKQIIRDMPTEFLCEIAVAQILATIQHARINNLTQQQLSQLIQQSFEVYWKGIKT
ncbi:TetR/AcrR family transcriptional regulator [uncultured Paraglaciecola sp.]|uniref:TetR/AcrR family transcriptional regulator n=1 Tax=uncultured Paraglaciecola sp. TaxID=1765024 RepID=UPI0025CDE4A2|nr:TetR/AcrR family transcriptional regulator [uncultured Paraglaciecola sp.]